jgi:signal transduction histidine kinase
VTVRRSVLLATPLVALAVLLAADFVLRANLTPAQASTYSLFFDVAFGAFAVSSTIAGTLIVVRQRRNVIGWLLLAVPLWAAFAFVAGDYATYALVTAPRSLPFGRAMAWIDRWAIVPTLSIPSLLFLLFPDGRVPSRRWRPVLWLACAAPAVTALLFALTPGRMTGAFADLTRVTVTNPTGIAGAGGVITTLSEITGGASLVAAVLAGASLVTRFRSRRGDERQQIKWLAFVGVAFLAEFALTAAVAAILGHGPAADAWGNAMYAVMFGTLGLGIPAACAVAILKYRLYDIDVVISKALVYAVLAGFITAVYVLLVVGVGSLAGLGGQPSLGLSILATAVVAVAFQPVRTRAQRLANRLVYGQRATPYQALAQLSERMAGTYATESLLPTMATIVAGATGASRADVWLRDGGELHAVASWPADAGPRAAVALTGGALPAAAAGADRLVEVRYDGELLGALSVTKKRGDAVTPTEDRLIGNLATQAGLVLRNAGLTEQLMARLADLRASRERLVTAQDRERRRLERDLRDGAQRDLAGLAGKLGQAAAALDRDEAQAKALLNDVTAEIAGALAGLRELARGIYPPLLADLGVAAALDAQARKAPIAVSVEADGIGRYPQEIEAAVYFCAVEALRSAAGQPGAACASVRLSARDGELRFEVAGGGGAPGTGGGGPGADAGAPGTDGTRPHTGRGLGADGGGSAADLQAMADRIDALGGEIRIDPDAGPVTRISGSVPAAAIGLWAQSGRGSATWPMASLVASPSRRIALR